YAGLIWEKVMPASAIARNPTAAAAIAVVLLGAAAILGAYYFQYVLGLAPCPLCLEQRIAYYVAIPLALILALAAWRGAPRALLAAGLATVALDMLVRAGLGAYPSEVEWMLWSGPADCLGPVSNLGRVSDLMQQLRNVHVVRCDDAHWSFLGLSLAGYNVLISLVLAGIAVWGVANARRSA